MMKFKDKVAIANALLDWLNHRDIHTIKKVYFDVIVQFSNETDYELYEIWKAWDLLRYYNRVEGKYNSREVVSYDHIDVDVDENINHDASETKDKKEDDKRKFVVVTDAFLKNINDAHSNARSCARNFGIKCYIIPIDANIGCWDLSVPLVLWKKKE